MVEHEKLSYGVIVEDEVNKKFNIRLNDDSYVCEEWFDKYKTDENSERVIIGYKKTEEELKNSEYNSFEYKYGGINNGVLNVKPVYDFLIFNNEDTYTAYVGDRAGYVDSKLGIEMTPIMFDMAGLFNEGEATIVCGSKEERITRNQYKLATADGIVYRFNKYGWSEKKKTLVLDNKKGD